MSFSAVNIVWCTISYLLYLSACVYLCGALDGMQFEEQQDQGYEGPEQQQRP